jgi:tape measure domain-containing protein
MDAGTLKVNLMLDGKDFTVSVRDAEKMLRQLKMRFEDTGAAVDRMEAHIGSVTTKFRHFVTTLGMARFAMMDIYDVFLRLPAAVVKTTGEIERMTMVMSGLSKASTDAGRMMEAAAGRNFIFDMAKTAPFQVKAIQDSFIKLKSAGIDPTNGSLRALLEGVAKFGGDSETLHRASIAIQQMAGKGVISMEELRQQLGEAIPTAMQQMADGAGMSLAELTKHISKGQVQSKEALERMFFVMTIESRGAAARMMDTFTGLTQRLGTEWTLLQNTIGNSGLMDAVKGVMKDLLDQFGKPQNIDAAKQIGKAMGDFVLQVRDAVKWLISMWDYIKLAGTAFAAYFAAGKVTQFVAALGAGIGSIANAYKAGEVAQRSLLMLQQEAMVQNARFDQQSAAARTEMLNRQLVEQQAQYNKLKAMHEAYLLGIKANEAAYTMQIKNGIPVGMVDSMGRPANAADMAANQAWLAAERKKLEMIERAMQRQQEAIKVTQAGAIATFALSQQKEILAEKLNKVGVGAQFMAGAMSAGRFVLTALGGWIGIVTIALTLGVFWWDKWANAGEKAISKVRDSVNKGFATREDVETLNKALAEKQAQLATVERNIQTFSNRPTGGRSKADVAGDQAAVRALETRRIELQKEIAALQSTQIKATTQADNSDIDTAFEVWKRKMTTAQEARFGVIQSQIANDTEETELRIKNNKLNADQEAKELEALNLRKRQLMAKFAKEEMLAAIGVRKEIQIQLGSLSATDTVQRGVLERQLQEATKRVADATRFSEIGERVLKKMEVPGNGKPVKDPLARALEKTQGELNSATIKLEDLEDGVINFDSIYKATLNKLMSEAVAGQFDIQKNAEGKFEPLLNEAGNFISEARRKQFQDLVETQTKLEAVNRARQIATQLLKLQASATEDERAAVERLSNSGEKQGTAYERITRQLERMKQQLSDQQIAQFLKGQSFDEFAKKIQGIAARTDLSNMLGDLLKTNAKLRTEAIVDDRARRQAEFNEEVKQLNEVFRMRMQNYLDTTQASADRDRVVEQAFKLHTERMQLMNAAHARAMRTPLEQLRDQWLNVTKQMEDAGAKWANSIVDGIVQAAQTGRYEWRKLLEGMLLDILRMQLQKQLAVPLTAALKAVGDWVLQNIFGKAVSATPGVDPKAAMDAQTIRLTTSLTAADTGMLKLDSSLTLADSALAQFTSSLEAASAAAAAAAGANGAGLGGLVGSFAGEKGALAGAGAGDLGGNAMIAFAANGGVMSSVGMMSLEKYARGGIANKPQLAMFGEGSMNEAYVPLPDGRRIPVDMRGQDQPNVQVNVINQTGQQVDAKQNVRMDGKKMILDVVLTAANQPGAFRDALKSAVRN